MRVIRYPDIKSYFSENLEFLEREETVNNLLIGIPRSLLSAHEGSANINLYSVKNEEGEIIFSLVQTPPLNYLIYADNDVAPSTYESLIRELITANIKAAGVIGPEAIAYAFAEQWQRLSGREWKIGFQQLIYQLDELQPVPPSSGTLRLARNSDLEIIMEWMRAFEREAMGVENPHPEKETILQRIQQHNLYVWEDGKPVAMTATSRPTRHGITLNYVYTPREMRGRGYASSCVYEVSKKMLQQYRFCNLFTDRNNPTSNKIYTRMGYYPVKKFVEIKFT